MNYGDIQTEVQTLLIDAPTAVTQLTGRWVNRAVRKLQTKHDFKDMEASVTYTTIQFTRTLASPSGAQRPSDWKKNRGKPYLTRNLGDTSEMQMVASEAEAQFRWGTSVDLDFGEPQALYEDPLAQTFLPYPYPDGISDYDDGEYRITIPYWKFLGQLVSPSDENWFTTNAEQWIVYQAVAEGFYANEDEGRAQLWETRAAREYKDVVLLDKTRRYSEVSTLVYHTGARMPHTQE